MSQPFHGNGHSYNQLPHLGGFETLPDPSTSTHPILPSIYSDASRSRPSHTVFDPLTTFNHPHGFATSRTHPTSAPPNIHLPQIKSERPSLAAKKDYISTPPAQRSPPTHVVGSQGRRGILPSATGRPSAVNNQTVNGGKHSPQLVKDADGKYPCPHCNKPYLHAKHLKRHMLRRESLNDFISLTNILQIPVFDHTNVLYAMTLFQEATFSRGISRNAPCVGEIQPEKIILHILAQIRTKPSYRKKKCLNRCPLILPAWIVPSTWLLWTCHIMIVMILWLTVFEIPS